MERNWYFISLIVLVGILLAVDITYGILLGSFSSLLRATGHLALLIVLIVKHAEVKFSIALWAWVMLIILPAVYPIIAGLFLISGFMEGIEMNKLVREIVWIILGIFILLLNRNNKFSLR